LPILPYKGKTPAIHEGALVSQYATVIGDVVISEGASVFPGAVIRGDVAKITIGKYSNIQDNVVIHGGDIYEGDVLKGNLPVEIGDYVTVAHGAIVHGSKIEDITLIGMNATLLENTLIPRRSVVVGVPAKVIKKVDDVTYSRTKKHAIRYYELAKSHEALF